MLRCDGTDQRNPDKPDLSAIFMSIPHFDIGKWKPPNAPKDGSLHLPRGLFQGSYPQEIALDRDGEQTFRKLRGMSSDRFLRVPQLWALLLNSSIIITCGPSSLISMVEEHIEFVKEEDLLTRGPSLVHVIDFERRVTYIPVEKCRSFIGLQRSIEVQCLADTDLSLDDCVLHSGLDQEELVVEKWPKILKEEKSIFVYVRISLREEIVPDSDGTKAIEALDESRLIEYASLSSDESGDEGDKMALVVFGDRYALISY